jgi:hypothetical protein
MDYGKLIAPYSEKGLRTLGGQIKWLVKKGLPQHSIDHAVATVYKEMELGKTFRDGHEFDQELYRVAQEHEKQEMEETLLKRIGQIEADLDSEWNKLTTWQKLWEVVRGRA